jgi:hypothetical protein
VILLDDLPAGLLALTDQRRQGATAAVAVAVATLPKVIDLSRRARRVVVANLIIAGAVIAGLVSWDLAGHLPLPLGVAGREGSTVIVGLNGMRLLRGSAWRRAGGPAVPRRAARRIASIG